MTRSAGRGLVLAVIAAGILALLLLGGWIVLYDPGVESPKPLRNSTWSETAEEDPGRRAASVSKSDPAPLTEIDVDEAVEPFEIEPGGSTLGGEEQAADEAPLGSASVAGRVLIEGTGAPAAGMKVIAQPSSGANGGFFGIEQKEELGSSIVADDGTYRITGLAAGEASIFPATGDSDCVDLDFKQWKTIAFANDEEITDIDFVVSLGGTVLGRVIDRPGDPVEGAMVRPRPASGAGFADYSSLFRMAKREKLITDESGRFEIRGVRFGRKVVVSVTSKEHAPTWTDPLLLEEGRPEIEITVTLDRGSSIIGIARTPDGHPAASVQVYAMPVNEEETDRTEGWLLWGQKMKQTVTDEMGGFRLKHVSAGRYQLRGGDTSPFDLLAKNEDCLEVEVDGVNDVTDVLLTAEAVADVEKIATISGLVLDHLGSPVAGVEVVSKNVGFRRKRTKATVTTDEQGAFTLEELASGKYNLTASKVGFDEGEADNVDTNGEFVRITLNRFATIHGKVVTRDGTSPESFRVRAQRADGDSAAERRAKLMSFMNTDPSDQWTSGRPDGTFVLGEVPTGRVEVLAEARGFAPNRSEELSVLPGQELKDVVINLLSGATLRGRVLLSSGEPVLGARVKLHSAQGDEKSDRLSRMLPDFLTGGDKSPNTVTNKSGEFELRDLAPGRYSVSASHPRYASSADIPVFIQQSDVVAPDLILSKGGTIEGVVVRDDVPQGGFMVQCMGGAPLQMMTTGDDGTFVFERLSDGEYMLSFVDTGAMRSGRAATMKARQVTINGEIVEHVRVELGSGQRVYGKIEGVKEGEMTMITIRRPGGPGPEDYDPTDPDAAMEAARFQVAMAFVGTSGTYEIIDLEAGEYILEIPAMPRNFADVEAYAKMDRTPRFRKDITIRNKDLELDIRLDVE